MAGGTFLSQNKVLPGVYINFSSNQNTGLSVSQRGVVAICEPMSWGPVAQMQTVSYGADTTPYCGYSIYTPQAQFLNEIFKGTDRTNPPYEVLLWRPAATSSAQATATSGALTITALYPGVRGNDITVSVAADPDNESSFIVKTYVDGVEVDRQTQENIQGLVANDWVTFSGTGALSAQVGISLTGGADGTVENAAYSTFLSALEAYDFDIVIYDGTDATTQAAFTSFAERMSNNNGKNCQVVMYNATAPDSRFTINLSGDMTGVTLSDGTALTGQKLTWWVGGAEAGAQYDESLTYAVYPDAKTVTPALTTDQISTGVQAGNLYLSNIEGSVRIVQDINSLTTFTQDITAPYQKNRIIRTLSTLANDLSKQFAQGYIGIVDNNDDGRSLFKSAIVGYIREMESNGAITNFSPDDVEVLAGKSIDSIVININIQPVDAVEKIYITVYVN